MNRYMLSVVVGIALSPLPGCSRAGSAKDDKDRLQGTWTGVSAESGWGDLEKPDNPISEAKVIFKDDKCIFIDKKKTTETTYELDETSSPKAIDILVTDKFGEVSIGRGIYLLEDDKLTLCLTEKIGAERPTDFTIKTGGTTGVLVFQRKKGWW